MKNNFIELGNEIEIECKRKNGDIVTTRISAEDFVKVSKVQTTWFAHTDNKGKSLYIRGNYRNEDGEKKIALLHRVITDCPSGLVVNHLSGDTLNNTRENLEVTTQRKNIIHAKKLAEVFVRKSKRFPNFVSNFYEVLWVIDNEVEVLASVHLTKNEALIRKYLLEIRQRPALMKYKAYSKLFKELGYDFSKVPFEKWFGDSVPKLLTGQEIHKQLKEVR